MRRIGLVAAAAVVLAFGCQKDDALPSGALTLMSEGYGTESGGQKTSVAGATVQWEGGERVWLNGGKYSVVVSGGTAYVQGGSLKDVAVVYGYSPAGIVKTNGSNTTPTVEIPSRYKCSYADGRQVLELPMVAYRTEASGTIRFRHLTAGVKVVVRNSTGRDDFWVDSVEVASEGYRLGGEVKLDLTADDFGLKAQAGSGAVRVWFPFESVRLASGSTLDVQVPILPVGNDKDLTIRIYAHSKTATVLGLANIVPANYSFHYSKSAAPQQSLGRNMLMEARCAVADSSANVITIDRGLFSIAGGTKVHFAKGNVQYVGAGWQFAEHQYDRLGSQADGNRDLFGWGTGSAPDMTSTDNADYGTFTDWGKNTISGDTGWRTLSSTEWDYLLNGRSAPEIGVRCARVNVCELLGLAIFPDGYEHPAGVTSPATFDLSTDNYTITDWGKMEAAGAVFLPADGIRSGTSVSTRGGEGNYWSSTSATGGKAHRLLFSVGDFAAFNTHDKYLGCSVRLVKKTN